MVESGGFADRLRNVHLEKSVATGICRVQHSPKTAKTPLKVHLRLRFQNLGKPRTAGLCGRAAGACDCGPLSCAKIERPSPLEKPSCKVRLFAQNRSRNYRQKVTATTLFQTASYSDFQLLLQTPHVCFRRRKRVHTRLRQQDRTQRLTRRNTGHPSPPATVRLVPPVRLLCNTTRFHRAFIYIHFPVLCEPPLSATALSQTIFHRVFQLLAQTAHICFHSRKRVHSRLSEKDRTQGHTRRNTGRFGRGWYLYPQTVLRVSETLRGQVSERQTLPLWGLGLVCSRRMQRAFGTAMRLCAPLFRGVAAPLGCAVLMPLFVQYDLERWKDLTKRSGRVTITRNNRTASRLALVWEPL